MKKEFELFLDKVVTDNRLHALWLNTLSMMENTGAKKIAGCQHPVFVTETILKHASEESRHGYYLKKQIAKVAENACPTYEKEFLLAANSSYYYLHKLDIDICRFLKEYFLFTGENLKYSAYLLVTYAIEIRADELYPVYQKALDRIDSRVNVKSIIAEEVNHLAEMNRAIDDFFPDGNFVRQAVISMEKILFEAWTLNLYNEVSIQKELNNI